MKTPFQNLRRWRTLGLAACVALAACGGSGGSGGGGGGGGGSEGPQDGGGDPPASDAPACEQEHYACSWSEVALGTANRSIALGEEAAARLQGGASTTAVAAWLQQNEALAEIQYDEGLMRLRLQGGRPVWIARRTRLDPDAAASSAPIAAAAATSPLQRAAGVAPAGGIVRPDVEQKRALILVPFRHEANAGDSSRFSGGAEVAQSLEATRGYDGRVTLLENAAEASDDVTVDSFSTFGNHDVIFVQTHGGQLCYDLQTGQSFPCKSFISAQLFHGSAIDLVNSTTRGVELMIVDDGHKQLILTDDYFRSQYPSGLSHSLVFISACNSYDSRLAQALEGPGTNYIGWSQVVTGLASSAISPQLFAGLAGGRTLQAVYADMSLEHETHDEGTGADLLIGAAKLRIRELLTVRDESSGQPLATGASIHINGFPEDGSPDSLTLLMDVDGVEDGEADKFILHLEIDGQPFAPMPLSAGTQAGAHAWRLRSDVPLGVDVHSGQVLKIHAWVDLPEGGRSSIEVSPQVTQIAVGLGSVYQGTSTRVWNLNGGPTITAKANATFRLQGSLGQPQARYEVVEGTMTVTFSDNPQRSICGYSGSVVVPMPVNPLNRITVDTATLKYSGYGQSAGPMVEVTETCPGQAPHFVSFDSSSIWFVANEGDAFVTDGSEIEGSYQSSATSRFHWSFSKVE